MPENYEIWKWVAGVIISAAAGMTTAVATISRVIFKIDKQGEDIEIVKAVLFKKTGGMNVMTEARHVEVCSNTMRFFEQDFEHIKERMDAIEEKLDIVLNTANYSDRHGAELRQMKALMLEISKKLNHG